MTEKQVALTDEMLAELQKALEMSQQLSASVAANKQKSTDKLFVPDCSPPEMKKTVRITEQCLENMKSFKTKADDGSLTFADLDQLSKMNTEILADLPVNPTPDPNAPPRTSDLSELEKVSKARAKEAEILLEKEGGPVFKISSFEQLKELSKKEPEAIAEEVLAAARQKRESVKNQEVKLASAPLVKPSKTPEVGVESNLAQDHLSQIATLLQICKDLYFKSNPEWHQILDFEKLFEPHLDGITENCGDSEDFLTEYLTDQSDDENCDEKIPAAAFVMASLENKDRTLEKLIDIIKKDDQEKYSAIQALKYGLNPQIDDLLYLESKLASPRLNNHFIDIFDYRSTSTPDFWKSFIDTGDVKLTLNILEAYAKLGWEFDHSKLDKLLTESENELFEQAVYVSLLTGKTEAIKAMRVLYPEHLENVKHLPLYVAMAGESVDLTFIKKSVEYSNSLLSTVQALGIMGTPACIQLLIATLKESNLEIQTTAIESLNLITNANLDLAEPQLKEGPQGMEFIVTVETGWDTVWNSWWVKNKEKYIPEVRYRRGEPFTLGSCIDEMANPNATYWTRQYSYYELLIRSGARVSRFEADWWVNDQLKAIEKWNHWYQETKENFPTHQWLFNGS